MYSPQSRAGSWSIWTPVTRLCIGKLYRQLLSHGSHSSWSGPSCTCLYTSVASSSDSLLSASHLSHGSHSSRSGPSCTCLYTSVASSSDSLLSASHQADVILAPGRSTVAIPASGSCTSSRPMRSLDLLFQNPLDQWEVCGGVGWVRSDNCV